MTTLFADHGRSGQCTTTQPANPTYSNYLDLLNSFRYPELPANSSPLLKRPRSAIIAEMSSGKRAPELL
jgi:hypothetical protein